MSPKELAPWWKVFLVSRAEVSWKLKPSVPITPTSPTIATSSGRLRT
jgi:hypothetical protein